MFIRPVTPPPGTPVDLVQLVLRAGEPLLPKLIPYQTKGGFLDVCGAYVELWNDGCGTCGYALGLWLSRQDAAEYALGRSTIPVDSRTAPHKLLEALGIDLGRFADPDAREGDDPLRLYNAFVLDVHERRRPPNNDKTADALRRLVAAYRDLYALGFDAAIGTRFSANEMAHVVMVRIDQPEQFVALRDVGWPTIPRGQVTQSLIGKPGTKTHERVRRNVPFNPQALAAKKSHPK